MARGAKTLRMDSDSPLMYVGKSHRPMGHLVIWSLLIRLWAGVLVYETLGVKICGEDTDVQSRGPLFVGSESCPGKEAGVPGPPGKWLLWSVTLPYISGLSKSNRRVLAPLAIQVTFRPYRTLRQELVHAKDPIPANRRKGVVYSIACAECPRTYIGQTGRSLDHRLHEHRRALKNGDLGSSAPTEHVFSANPSSGSIEGHGY